jgi:hypothetical protein
MNIADRISCFVSITGITFIAVYSMVGVGLWNGSPVDPGLVAAVGSAITAVLVPGLAFMVHHASQTEA